MTDDQLISKRLALIETCVAQLRSTARTELIHNDIREERFVEHTLQLAIQATLDVASHIVSDERLGEPRTNRELFDLLARSGWIGDDLVPTMRSMAGFRNVLVHGYADIDLDIVREMAEERLDDLLTYAEAVRVRLAAGDR